MRAAFKDDAKDKDKDSDSDSKHKKDKKSSRNDSKGLVLLVYLNFAPEKYLKYQLTRFYPMHHRFGWSKRKVPLSRSGRVIKGRGVFVSIERFKSILKHDEKYNNISKQRYRTPSRSRSRSRSVTPPHWKQAQKRVIKLTDLEVMNSHT